MRIGPLGIWELLIILVVVLLIFGPRRLPEMAKGLGQSVREFRKGIRDIRNDFEEGESGESKTPQQTASPAQRAPSEATTQSDTTSPPAATAASAASAAASSEGAADAEDATDDAGASDDDPRTKAASDAG